MKAKPSTQRRRFGSALLLAALLPAAGLAQGQDLSAVEITTTRLSDTLHMLQSDPPVAGNLAVSAGPDGVLLVDDKMMPITPKIKAAIAKIQEGGVDFVVNTHYHFDHAGGNAAFGLEALILAHETVRTRLLEGREAGARFSATPTPTEALPVVTFRDSVTLHWNGERVDIIHLGNPAHTDGDAVIHFHESNVLHTGDQFITLGGFPYIDRDVGGSATGLRDNLTQILELIDDETRIIPGHGPLATKKDLIGFHDLVSRTIEHVEGEKKAGRSLEEIQSAGLPAEFESYGGGFIPEDGWIQFVFSSLDD